MVYIYKNYASEMDFFKMEFLAKIQLLVQQKIAALSDMCRMVNTGAVTHAYLDMGILPPTLPDLTVRFSKLEHSFK